MGTINLKIHNKLTNQYDILVLEGVSHLEKAPNLISTGKLNLINMHINTVNNTLFHTQSDMHVYNVSVSPDHLLVLPCLISKTSTPASGTDHLISKQPIKIKMSAMSVKTKPYYDDDIKLNPKIFEEINGKYGPFEKELFASDTNHHLDDYFTASSDSYTSEWTKSRFYGNPVFTNEYIYKTLQKAVADFQIAPHTTKFVFVLPKWETSPWYKTFMDYFQIVEEYPEGTPRVFTVPHLNHNPDTETSVDGRAFLGPIRWPVIVIFKDVYTITGINSAMRAHLRFGHISLDKIRALQITGIETDIIIQQLIKTLQCSCCYLTKAKRTVLNRAMKRPSTVPVRKPGITESQQRQEITVFGHLVFSDILYMNIPSIDGELYVLHFVDCASRYCKTYFLKKRDVAYACLQYFIDWVKSRVHVLHPQTKNCVRIILSDRGGEYVSDEWKQICTKNNVQCQYTNAGVHEEANIAERVWQTLQDCMRAMMCTAKFTKKEWALAFDHAVWLYNRMPHAHHKNILSPSEFVTGLKPNLGKVRVFGTQCFQFQYKEQRPDKLSDRAKSCLYVGHSEDKTNAYKFYYRDSGKVILGGIASFVENISECGKLLSSFDSSHVFDFETKINRPQPFLDAKQYDQKVTSINNIDVYFDKEDNETYVCLHVTQLRDEPDTWIRGSSLFFNNSGTAKNAAIQLHNITLLNSYIKTHKLETLQPMLQTVWVQYEYKNKQPEYMTSVILGNDPVSVRKWSVVHTADGFCEDVSDKNMIWKKEQIPHPGRVFSTQENFNILEPFSGEMHHQLEMSVSSKSKPSRVTFGPERPSATINSISGSPSKYINYKEPLTYKQAQKLPDAAEWQEATEKELQQFIDLDAIIPIKRGDVPKDKNITESKLVFKVKLQADGSLDKYKVRLVAKGFTQIYGVDYYENFSPTPMIGGVRFVLIFILQHKLKRASGDVTGAFLNSTLKEEVYLRLPEGLELKGSSIVKLIKSLYGLKQAARDWYELSDKIIRSFDPDLIRSETEPCIYFKMSEACKFMVSVHVDDYIFGYENDNYFSAFLKHFEATIKMTISPEVDFMLQMKLEWTENSVTLSQNRQIESLVKKFNLCDSKKVFFTPMETKLKLTKGDSNSLPDFPYRELVCSLLFIARYTRPDILFSVTLLCRFLTNFTEIHWNAAKRVLCYLSRTTDWVLTYTRDLNAPILEIYTDSDWGSDQIDGRSTTGLIINLYGNPVMWVTEKQTNTALSTSEAEYIAITAGFKEAKYFFHLMQVEMKIRVTPIKSWIDNVGAGFMAEQSVTNKRTKHINLRYHYVREEISEFKNFEMEYIPTKENTSDIFTKPLDRTLFEHHRKTLMKQIA